MKDFNRHRIILLNILKDVYQHPRLASQLGFKGGTSLYFAHNLPRFSVDLDFNILPETDFNDQDLDEVLRRHMKVVDRRDKQYTWFWLGDYGAGEWNVKIEVSKRDFNERYELIDIYGLAARLMILPDQFAHKLLAITERKAMVNRDIFDAWWFFKQGIEISAHIIEKRTGQSTEDYLRRLIDYIPANLDARGVLNGLGELVDDETKQWTKSSLLKELLFYLRAALSSHESA